MRLESLIDNLNKGGVVLTADGDAIRFRPKGVLTPADL